MISLVTYRDYPAIVNIWERSVRATHNFLPEDYLLRIKSLLPSILPHVKVYAWRDKEGAVKGFAGVAGQKMEMLFVHPDSMRRRIGSQLANFCIYALGVDQVDVNEQNEQAVAFYKKIGYELIGRKELDSMGKPFPILHMLYQEPNNKSQISNKHQALIIK